MYFKLGMALTIKDSARDFIEIPGCKIIDGYWDSCYRGLMYCSNFKDFYILGVRLPPYNSIGLGIEFETPTNDTIKLWQIIYLRERNNY